MKHQYIINSARRKYGAQTLAERKAEFMRLSEKRIDLEIEIHKHIEGLEPKSDKWFKSALKEKQKIELTIFGLTQSL